MVGDMDETLLWGEERHCPDCGTLTVCWPVDRDDWVCTDCDGVVSVPVTAA